MLSIFRDVQCFDEFIMHFILDACSSGDLHGPTSIHATPHPHDRFVHIPCGIVTSPQSCGALGMCLLLSPVSFGNLSERGVCIDL